MKHRKAKAFHFVALTIISLLYGGTFRALGWALSNLRSAREQFGTDIGFVPSEVQFILYFIHLAVCLALMLLVFGMMKRKDSSRKLLVKLMPVLAFLETINFYQVWISAELGIFNDMTVIFIGGAVMGGLAFSVMALYNANFMRVFFNPTLVDLSFNEEGLLDNDVLTDNSESDSI